MASKVLLKMSMAPFTQINQSKGSGISEDVISVSTSVGVASNIETQHEVDNPRITQLEQNIRFLQEQHQQMLTGLHSEIESLRNRNRELQFQLIFAKGTLPSSPSSPEDDSKPKPYVSPKSVNVTPLQVEILEKEVGEFRIQLEETERRNLYLSAIVDEQKKKLERYERDREKERERAFQPDPELLRKLDDAEAIIRRLRRENSDLRREHATGSSFQLRDSREVQKGSNHGRSNGRYRGGNGGNNYKTNWFPTLHSQNFWAQGHREDRSNRPDMDLPNLPNSSNNIQQFHERRGTNNNLFHGNDGRKQRGSHHKNAKTS